MAVRALVDVHFWESALMINPPNPPAGDGLLVNWCKRIWAFCLANRLQEGLGYKIIRKTNGFSLAIDTPGGGSSSSPSAHPVGPITEVRNSIIVIGSGGGTIYVAKPLELRYTIGAETIDGTNWIYTYDSTFPATDTKHQARIAASGSYQEQQVITPRYLIGQTIYVIQPTTTLITAGDLLDSPGVTPAMVILQDTSGREWAQKYGTGA